MSEVELLAQQDPERVAIGRRKLIVRRFLRNKPAVVAGILLLLLVLAAFAGPSLMKYDYQYMDSAALLQPPGPDHWLGTNENGQDVLSQTLRGMQKSLAIGFGVALLSSIIASLTGAVAGLLGGWTDRMIMWVVDLLLVIPSFLMIMLFAQRTKGSNSVLLLIVLLAAFGWMISARVVRGLTMSLREREFVRAARYMGASTWTVITTHILPNVASFLIIDTTLAVGASIIGETSLSYLGFGVQWPEVSLGVLIGRATDNAQTFPWTYLVPGGALILIVLCANIVGDGLRDALDPSSQRARSKRKADK
ncbi:ABC transporter permease [Nocardia stercoris]|uniref:Oligopeptide transport system permease protein OppC n=1 Tax=Nocardia stercoris TaxID=2483361 RepID=A0A3M2LAY0_9NOCA|nr:ABC transporter permease [Nocardia stercoris]RMI34196.1 ABC transporter permease [Nocardia stercoris]